MGAHPAGSDVADLIRATERERLRALVAADLSIADRLHADDFQLINPGGGVLTKAQYLGGIASGYLNYRLWEPDSGDRRAPLRPRRGDPLPLAPPHVPRWCRGRAPAVLAYRRLRAARRALAGRLVAGDRDRLTRAGASAAPRGRRARCASTCCSSACCRPSATRPLPGYLIRTDDGTNVLVDTGYPPRPPRPAGGGRRRAARGPPRRPGDGVHRGGRAQPPRRRGGPGRQPPGRARARPAGHRLPGLHALRPRPRRQPRPLHGRRAGGAAPPLRRGAPAIPASGSAAPPGRRPGCATASWTATRTLLPGIELIETGGHVPGHQSVLVRLPETGPVLLAIDAITGPEQLAPDAPDMLAGHGPRREAGERPEAAGHRRARGRAADRFWARPGAVAGPAEVAGVLRLGVYLQTHSQSRMAAMVSIPA